MRRTDSLSPVLLNRWDNASKDAINQLCERMRAISPRDFILLRDRQDLTAMHANRSGCVFAAIRFDTPVDAATFWVQAQALFPNVGMEMHSSPNGLVDKGDGVTPRAGTVFGEYSGRYVPDTGPSYTVLIDMQNLRRHLAGDERGSGVPLEPAEMATSLLERRVPIPVPPVEVLSAPLALGGSRGDNSQRSR